jgi:Spy/CpxP family protein refolding chaperone
MDRPEVERPAAQHRTRRAVLYGILASSVLAALVAARPIAAAVQEGGWKRLHGRWGHGARSPEAMREHVEVGVKWALRSVDASEDQQKRVSGILTGALDVALKLRDRHRENREAFAAAFTGATVDRAALEEARKVELVLADEASQLLVKTLADAADVLTPEQRQELLEYAHRFRH